MNPRDPRPKSGRRAEPELHAVTLQAVPFHDDTLEAVAFDGKVFASLRRLCECLGADFASQFRRLKDKERSPWSRIVMMTIQDTGGRKQDACLIDVETIPQWLNTMDARRVGDEVKPKLQVYQRECADALRDHFFRGQGVNPRRQRYERQGKPSEWVETRIRGIDTRREYTGVLSEHGVEGRGYADCTNAIYRPILGGSKAAVAERRGIGKSASFRDRLAREELNKIALAEDWSGKKIDKDNAQGNDGCAEISGRAALAITELERRFLQT